MNRLFRNMKFTALLMGAAAMVFASAPANAAKFSLDIADSAGLSDPSRLSVEVGVIDLGNQWAITIANNSTVNSAITGFYFESGLATGVLSGNRTLHSSSVHANSARDSRKPLSLGDWTGGFSYLAPSYNYFNMTTGVLSNGSDRFHLRVAKSGAYTTSDLLDLFLTQGSRIAVEMEVAGHNQIIGMVSGSGGNQGATPIAHAPTPAAFGAGMMLLTGLCLRRRNQPRD